MSQQQVAQELLLHGFGLASFFIKLALVRLATVKSDSNKFVIFVFKVTGNAIHNLFMLVSC